MEEELINKCIEYVIQNMDEDISVKEVADHFHYSEYYFCREFKEMTGKSVYQFIKALKMDQSAVDIKLRKDKSITDIGLNYGYSSSNYSSAFKNHHRISPSEFRLSICKMEAHNPFYNEGKFGFASFEEYASKIKFKTLENKVVLYERVVGNYNDLKEKWPAFIKKNKDFVKADTLFIERFYNDPSITDIDSCIYDICMTIDEQYLHTKQTMTIEGGKFAIYHYKGKIRDIFCSVQGIFSVWLASSEYTMRERYAFNVYPKMDINSDDVIMDLCIPVE
ncbi:MAG TPA: AraC family transcriptional regulator [Lachnospiraceae bacterium]|nr:AraC family transcriptional regulator [Lachnospiraceae bacterium]